MNDSSPRAALLCAAVMMAAVTWGLFAYTAPAPVPASAPDTHFSAERALTPLRTIAREAHPMGSVAHDSVRGFVLSELERLGLEPQVQEALIARPTSGRGGFVRNVLARIPGSASSGAIVLLAHYDSVPASPGASDDGAGVAAILETVRALRAGPAIANDIIVLITDGEEYGLFGAQAFVQYHPWTDDVRLVLNVDSRGSRGPSIMFETSDNNGHLIREFAASNPGPVANSLTLEVYRLMPNGTDMTVFLDDERGFGALNFGFIHGHERYHMALDVISELDPGSVQHHGDNLLSAVRHFGQLDLADLAAPDRVYFSVAGLGLLHYPNAWALPLSCAAALLFLLLAIWGFRRGTLRLRGVLLGLLAFILATGLAVAAAHFGWGLVERLYPQFGALRTGAVYPSTWYLVGFAGLAGALYFAVYRIIGRWATSLELAFVPCLLWAAQGIVAAVLAPGGSYLFVWPFAGVLMAHVVLQLGAEPGRAATGVLLGLFALPALVLISPWIWMLEVAMGIRLIGAVAGLLLLLLTLLAAPLGPLTRSLGWWCAAGLLGIAAAGFGMGHARSGFDEAHPQPSAIRYAVDGDTGSAVWRPMADSVDAWTAQFVGRGDSTSLAAPAPAWTGELPSATVQRIDDRFEVRVVGPPGTVRMDFAFEGEAVPSVAVRATEGDVSLEVPDSAGRRFFLTYAPPADGVVLILSSPCTLRVTATLYGIPPSGIDPAPRRPSWMMDGGDQTRITRTFAVN